MLRVEQKDNIRILYFRHFEEMTKGEIVDVVLEYYPSMDREEVDEYLEETFYKN